MALRSVAVALLFADDELAAQLRLALVELGARIVHEGPVASFGRDQVLASGADIVVVNLDDDADEHLERLYDAIDGDHPRLMFNDADASRRLDGWDRARWARHLAAKLLSESDIDPPRPVDARGLDVPAVVEPVVVIDEIIAPEPPPVQELAPLAVAEARSEALAAELEALLVADKTAAAVAAMDYSVLEEGDLPPDLAQTPDYVFGDAGPLSDRPEGRDEALALSEEFDRLTALPTANEDAPDYLFGSADHDGDAAAVVLSEEFSSFALTDEAFVPAEAVPASVVERFAESSLSLTPIEDAATDEVTVPVIESRATQIASPIPPEWSLVDADDVPAVATPAAPVSSFGVEKMSAAEFLAPDVGDSDAHIEPGLGLELVSMEEALAPGSDSDFVIETFLDSAAGSIRRVVVLGVASDSADAVALFLASVPSRLPAVLVLIQQDDAQALTRRLSVTTTLPVRVAEAGRFAAQSSILVVPAGMAISLRRDGQIALETIERDRSPIDTGFTLLAASFGADLTAIVFAGHSNDAVAGAQAVRDRGGRVWVEEPGEQGSPMVAGIREERIDSFAGHVAALAARLIEEMP